MTTDLYELTMAASYMTLGMNQRATFSLVHRRLPPHRGYLVVVGVAEALDRLERFRFDAAAIDYLRRQAPIAERGCSSGSRVVPTGDVREPYRRGVGGLGRADPRGRRALIEAQLVET